MKRKLELLNPSDDLQNRTQKFLDNLTGYLKSFYNSSVKFSMFRKNDRELDNQFNIVLHKLIDNLKKGNRVETVSLVKLLRRLISEMLKRHSIKAESLDKNTVLDMLSNVISGNNKTNVSTSIPTNVNTDVNTNVNNNVNTNTNNIPVTSTTKTDVKTNTKKFDIAIPTTLNKAATSNKISELNKQIKELKNKINSEQSQSQQQQPQSQKQSQSQQQQPQSQKQPQSQTKENTSTKDRTINEKFNKINRLYKQLQIAQKNIKDDSEKNLSNNIKQFRNNYNELQNILNQITPNTEKQKKRVNNAKQKIDQRFKDTQNILKVRFKNDNSKLDKYLKMLTEAKTQVKPTTEVETQEQQPTETQEQPTTEAETQEQQLSDTQEQSIETKKE